MINVQDEATFDAQTLTKKVVTMSREMATGLCNPSDYAGPVFVIRINGFTVIEFKEEARASMVLTNLRDQYAAGLWRVYQSGADDATNDWLDSKDARKLLALEAIADAQTVLAQKALTGSSTEEGTAGARVRERAAKR